MTHVQTVRAGGQPLKRNPSRSPVREGTNDLHSRALGTDITVTRHLRIINNTPLHFRRAAIDGAAPTAKIPFGCYHTGHCLVRHANSCRYGRCDHDPHRALPYCSIKTILLTTSMAYSTLQLHSIMLR